MTLFKSPLFGEKTDAAPAPQSTQISWSHLAGLLACAAAVFLFTFGVAMVGFGVGVSGGIAPFVAKDNETRLTWQSPPVSAAKAEEPLPPPTIIRPRRETTPPPEIRIVQASASELPADSDWQEGWADAQTSAEGYPGDEIIAPDAAQN